MKGSITLTFDGPPVHLRLCRPDKLNALDTGMISQLRDACDRVDRDANARVVILSGEGKGFCAGGDIDSWSDESPDEFGRHWVRDGHVALDALAGCGNQSLLCWTGMLWVEDWSLPPARITGSLRNK